jgi:amino acid transporter
VALSAAQAAPLTAYLSYTAKIFGGGSWETWFVGIPLIAALALSVLNAIMGVGRSLYQAAEDGQLPRWFQHRNRHGVPDYAMAFNVVCSMVLVLLGSPLRIYIISNGGYLLSCSLALLGYFIYRQLRPDTPRPFRLPTFAKWIALAIFLVWAFIYFYGGWNSPKIILADPHQGPGLYLLGLLIVALYAPLYWWRRWSDNRLAAKGRLPEAVPAAAGADLGAVASAPDGHGAAGRATGDGSVADPVGGAEAPPGDPPAAR